MMNRKTIGMAEYESFKDNLTKIAVSAWWISKKLVPEPAYRKSKNAIADLGRYLLDSSLASAKRRDVHDVLSYAGSKSKRNILARDMVAAKKFDKKVMNLGGKGDTFDKTVTNLSGHVQKQLLAKRFPLKRK